MSIKIRLNASMQEDIIRVWHGGTDVALTSEVERRSFKLNNFQSKIAAGQMVGKEPNDVYLREPIPWSI